MNTNKIYDIIGIGIGPFNLGLAALAADIPNLDCIFIDQKEEFNWHPGMMLPTAKMQVPFYADLVTLANPCSRFSYLAYLKDVGRLIKFSVNEAYYPYRFEFNAYCKWVLAQLGNMHFGYTCIRIEYQKKTKIYTVIVRYNTTGEEQAFQGKHVVVGTGSQPSIPACTQHLNHPLIFHSSEYLQRKDAALMNKRIAIVGSGQSAAEIFLDVLPHMKDIESLHWFTRSDRFHPMDYSKLSLEISSPDYIHYFYSLNTAKKKAILLNQQYLYRRINTELIQEIYQQLYWMELNKNSSLPTLRTSCELKNITPLDKKGIVLTFAHLETGKSFEHQADAVILATGYQNTIPELLSSAKEHIRWTDDGDLDMQLNYSIDENNSLFAQNAEWHTHGFNSADIGLGPYRNAVIINTILGKGYFKTESSGLFQSFDSR